MADLTVTAASVVASASAVKGRGTAGESITAGQPVYIDTSDSNKLKKADAGAAAAARVAGIALHAAAANQPLEYAIADPDFAPGATLSLSAAGDAGLYFLSNTAGGLCPKGDLVSGMVPVLLLVARSASKAVLVHATADTALTA